jgi:cytochrome c-type biogenesis protein CcmH/NrfF
VAVLVRLVSRRSSLAQEKVLSDEDQDRLNQLLSK